MAIRIRPLATPITCTVNHHLTISGGVENITDQRYRPYISGMAAVAAEFRAGGAGKFLLEKVAVRYSPLAVSFKTQEASVFTTTLCVLCERSLRSLRENL